MDSRSWLWKKRSAEKTLVTDKGNNSLGRNEADTTEIQSVQNEKANLEKELSILRDKLSSALAESNAKDDFAKKQLKIAQEAISGWEKADAQTISVQEELEKVLQQKAAAEERVLHLDAALKECMQQLRFVREEQEKRIHDAVVKTSKEFEKTCIILDEKLAEAGKRLGKLDYDNTQLKRALLEKEQMIEQLTKYKSQLESDFSAVMLRLETIEKENASLKYEVRVLEKELDIRNEEREFNRRTGDVAHRQHLESLRKIAKLQSECQRLRVLVQKRLPGPAALAKMKNEAELLGIDQAETQNRKSNPSPVGSTNSNIDTVPDSPSNRLNFLTKQLHKMEEENRILKEVLNKKANEFQISRIMQTRTASKLSQVESPLEESSKGHATAETWKHLNSMQDHSLASMSDIGIDDKASCADSWASALISELEHFKNEKQSGTLSQRTMGTSDMSLMDDFAEMEKLAVVSVDYTAGSSHNSSDEGNVITLTSERQCGGNLSQSHGKQWLNDILKLLLERSNATQRNPSEVLHEIKVALEHQSHSDSIIWDAKEARGYMDTTDRGDGGHGFIPKKSSPKFQSNMNIAICKMLELIEGINLSSRKSGMAEYYSGKDEKILSYESSETPSGYMVRVFQWKTSELSDILEQLIRTCKDLLNGAATLEEFSEQVASSLEWIMNHCFSLQDVSSMKDAIRNHFDWDDSRSESEVESGFINHFSGLNKFHVRREGMPDYISCYDNKMEEFKPNVNEEARRLSIELANKASSIADLEGRLQSEIIKSESLMIQVLESKNLIESLKSEMETMKQSNAKTEDDMEEQKMMKENLEKQLVEAKTELNKAFQKISYLETELENKNNSIRSVQEKCHALEIQQERTTNEGIPDYVKSSENQRKSDWEIAVASEKLAECQETILNLGKQLKALASPRDAVLFDKVIQPSADTISSTSKRIAGQRSSLRDKMLAEDNGEGGDLNYPVTTAEIQFGDIQSSAITIEAIEPPGESNNSNYANQDDKGTDGSLAIVPHKKGVKGLLKRLFWTKKLSKKTHFP